MWHDKNRWIVVCGCGCGHIGNLKFKNEFDLQYYGTVRAHCSSFWFAALVLQLFNNRVVSYTVQYNHIMCTARRYIINIYVLSPCTDNFVLSFHNLNCSYKREIPINAVLKKRKKVCWRIAHGWRHHQCYFTCTVPYCNAQGAEMSTVKRDWRLGVTNARHWCTRCWFTEHPSTKIEKYFDIQKSTWENYVHWSSILSSYVIIFSD